MSQQFSNIMVTDFMKHTLFLKNPQSTLIQFPWRLWMSPSNMPGKAAYKLVDRMGGDGSECKAEGVWVGMDFTSSQLIS